MINKRDYFKRPVFPILLSLISGVVTGFYFHSELLLYISVVFSVLSFLVCFKTAVKGESAVISPLLLFFFSGFLLIYPHMVIVNKTDHIVNYCDYEYHNVSGIVDESKVDDRRSVVVLRGLIVDGKKVSSGIRLSVSGNREFFNGEKIVFRSKIKGIRNFSNPGSFDYRRFMAFKKIYGRSYVNGKKIKVIPKERGLFENFRSKIKKLIDERKNTSDSKAVLKALIAGERKISGELRETFNRTGTGHVLAVSGLHMGIIAGFIFIVARFFLSFARPLLLSGNLNRCASILVVPGIVFYGILSGMTPSTQRAIMMVAAFVIALQIKKDQDILNTVLTAALVIIVINPTSVFSISFQLSFSAVFSILLFLDLKAGDNLNRSLKGRIKGFFIVTFAATIGTAPIVMYYFNMFSVVGLFANMIVVPVFSLLIIPSSLLVILFLFVNSILAGLFTDITLFLISKIFWIAEFLSSLEFAAVKTFKPTIIEIALFYMAVIVLRKIIKGKRKLIAVFTVIAVLMVSDAFYWSFERFFRDDVRITFLDVGQGNSALIELKGGETVLIDGGGYSNNRFFDMGKVVIAPFLLSKKILTVDRIVLSHANSDHMNGLIYIAENFNVKSLWSNHEANDTISYLDLLRTVEKNGIVHEKLCNFRSFLISDARFDILYPRKDFQKLKESWRDSNNNSLVLKMTFGKTSVLFPGDIEGVGEAELVKLHGKKLLSDILLIPHHGSASSSTKEFVETVRPKVGVISCGYRNRYGFPGKRVIDRYKKNDVRCIRVDQEGSVIFTIDKKGYRYKLYNSNSGDFK